MKGKFIKRYYTIKQISHDLNIPQTIVSKAMRKSDPVLGGYRFRYAKTVGYKKDSLELDEEELLLDLELELELVVLLHQIPVPVPDPVGESMMTRESVPVLRVNPTTQLMKQEQQIRELEDKVEGLTHLLDFIVYQFGYIYHKDWEEEKNRALNNSQGM